MFKLINSMKQNPFGFLPTLPFCCDVQLFGLEMEYHFIHMAAAVAITVPY